MRGGANVSLSTDLLKNVKVPIPPLEVQREIVRILDQFAELTAELTTELTARKKQYEYYRDELLTFGNNVPLATLGFWKYNRIAWAKCEKWKIGFN